MTADSCLALEYVAVHETRRRQQWVVLMFCSKGRKCHLLRCRDVADKMFAAHDEPQIWYNRVVLSRKEC